MRTCTRRDGKCLIYETAMRAGELRHVDEEMWRCRQDGTGVRSNEMVRLLGKNIIRYT